MFTVSEEGGYVIVRRNGEIICDAIKLVGTMTLRDISFANASYQKCNRTRQAAMKALQRAGYR